MKSIAKTNGLPYREQGVWKQQVVFDDGEAGCISGAKPSILRKRLAERGLIGESMTIVVDHMRMMGCK